ncbi:sulfite exporter TauE/SafE family protein [Paenibacillus sp. YYML68]|uniref:HoxN/HupN/NixA family nickel/cobalt transporter n=1 Tax=Paenibacillus sp. YYML68 TaxID=2909250 RepID=UPI00249231C5|nr:sulfite exporter TauE/SafE family protein [Paenibacillus sp. YYML68]
MDLSLLSILSFGFILGIKHAIEPDHVIAVSTIASESRRLSRSSLAGVYWGIGHTLTLFLTGVLLILLKVEIPEKWAMSFEFLVGIMLVYLGVAAIRSFRNVHVHNHKHDEVEAHHHVHAHVYNGEHAHTPHRHSSYGKSMLIGFIHGLAGSGAMVLLTMSTVSTAWEAALYIAVFGAGTVAGMLFFTTVIGIPFVLSTGKRVLNRALTQVTGAVSALFGVYYMYNLGVTEGLFKLWLQ